MEDKEFKEYVIDKLDKLDVAIRGNGLPGLNQRVHDLEADRQIRGTHRKFWTAGFLAIVGTLATLVYDGVKRALFGG